MGPLADIFEIAADAYEEERINDFLDILEQCGLAADWYWVIGPERGRPRPFPALGWGFSLGPRGTSFETGFVYTPYVPLSLTNLDAEAELTRILSEQIALEVDSEILEQYANRPVRPEYYGTVTVFGEE